MAKVWKQCCASHNNQGDRCQEVFSEEGRLCPKHQNEEMVFSERVVPIISYEGVFSFTDSQGQTGEFRATFQSPVEISNTSKIRTLALVQLLKADVIIRDIEIISWAKQK